MFFSSGFAARSCSAAARPTLLRAPTPNRRAASSPTVLSLAVVAKAIRSSFSDRDVQGVPRRRERAARQLHRPIGDVADPRELPRSGARLLGVDTERHGARPVEVVTREA